jgi:hypothetical protein
MIKLKVITFGNIVWSFLLRDNFGIGTLKQKRQTFHFHYDSFRDLLSKISIT